MVFPFDIEINLKQSGISNISNKKITVHGGVTIFLGPNGSGKTQLLRGLKSSLNQHLDNKIIRYVSAGRLGPMESYRSDYDGQRGTPSFDSATYGDKSSTRRRHKTETILGDFATLSERPDILIKVQERLRKLFKRDITIDWDGGRLRVYFSRVDQENSLNYSSAREASGLLNLVAILSALYDDEVKCLLIDEPEVSLHPQLQSFLLNEIKKVAGAITIKGKKLIFISTHSTEFLEINSVDQLASIVFCNDVIKPLIQIDPTITDFQGKKLKALLTRLGQEHKLALFCNKPLLVEGPSDQILCSAISKCLELNTDATGSQILPITGKGQFPVVLRLMRLIGKEPIILADSDTFTDGLEIISSFTTLPLANKLASEMGHRDAVKFSRDIYSDFCKLVVDSWETVKEECTKHYYWINRDQKKDENIAKRRAVFCWLFSNTDDKLSLIESEFDFCSIKKRLSILIDFLEKLGCFILRKGTIEAYYQHSSTLTNDEKPNAASYEVQELLEDRKENIEKNYADIVRALKYCSTAKEINEAEAIRDILLAVIAPALASIRKDTTDTELNVFSYSIIGKKSSLFKLSVINEHDAIKLRIDLNSDILDVTGFPMEIKKGDNPIEKVNEYLNIL